MNDENPTQASPTQQNQPMGAFMPVGNKPALIGYYCGVFGLIPFVGFPLAVIAVVLGVIGLKQHKLRPVPGGKGHAITALALGIFELSCFVAFFIVVNTVAQNS